MPDANAYVAPSPDPSRKREGNAWLKTSSLLPRSAPRFRRDGGSASIGKGAFNPQISPAVSPTPPRRRPGSNWVTWLTATALHYYDLPNWTPAFAGAA